MWLGALGGLRRVRTQAAMVHRAASCARVPFKTVKALKRCALQGDLVRPHELYCHFALKGCLGSPGMQADVAAQADEFTRTRLQGLQQTGHLGATLLS